METAYAQRWSGWHAEHERRRAYAPFGTPRDVTVGAAVEGLHHVYESPERAA